MQKYFSVFNSDQVSKDGKSFSISALEDGIWQASIYGVPSNLSHDIHRPIGWAFPKGLYFEFGKVLTVGYFLIAEDNEDISSVSNARKNFFTNLQNKSIDPFAEKFITILDKLYVEEKGKWFSCNMVLWGYKDIVHDAFPDLAKQINTDDDGLVSLDYLLSEFDYLSQGAFKKKNSELAINAHPYFRKSLSIYNNFHWIFLDELISLHSNKSLKIKIKIDSDFLGFAPSFLPAHEFEYWWGPKYDDDISKIPYGPTVYKSDNFEKLYYNIDRTEFVWKKEENLCTLELEEVKDEMAPTLTDTYACRYVHSIFDTEKNSFDHFDGAIRSYSTELMLERLDKKITEMGRRSVYTKLFRIDKNLPLSNWKSLVTNYMQGNPQIYEYFGLPKPEIQKIIEQNNPSPLEKFVPYSINKDDGVRLHVTYHQRKNDQPHDRFVSINDEITLECGNKDAIEYFTIELKKALNRLNTDLVLPSDCVFMLPEDYYANIPCIFHADNNNQTLLNETIQALRNLVDALELRSKKEVISSTLAWNLEDKEVRLCMLGHVSDLKKWLNSFDHIPIERTKFKKWLTNQAVFLQKNGKETTCPVLSEIFHGDGVLYMKRRLVQKDATLTFPDTSNPMVWEIECDDTATDLTDSLQAGKIYIAPSMILEKMICLKSGQDYTFSPYSVVLDDNVSQKIEECKLVSFHWTDKPRPISIA